MFLFLVTINFWNQMVVPVLCRKPDIRIPFIPEENGLISGLFLYVTHTVDKLGGAALVLQNKV